MKIKTNWTPKPHKAKSVKFKSPTSDWKAPSKITGDKEDNKLMGKGAYEVMLEKSRSKKVNVKATVGTY